MLAYVGVWEPLKSADILGEHLRIVLEAFVAGHLHIDIIEDGKYDFAVSQQGQFHGFF